MNPNKDNISSMFFCEFDLCIYNDDCECCLDEISISSTGSCYECIVPAFDGAVLEKAKKETIERLEKRSEWAEELNALLRSK